MTATYFSWSTPMSSESDDASDLSCDDCALTPHRRLFLKQVAGATIGALVMIGIPPGIAAAVTPTAVRAARRVGSNPAYPIPKADGVQIDKENQVILVRWSDHIYAFNLSCPHENTALRWNSSAAEFQCPRHHSKYRPDGAFISGRATRGMDRFAVKRNGNEIVVDLAVLHQDDTDHPGWAGAAVAL
jgi:nitrite reductase/ring-hydroxylating ferredoxin subunit